MTIRRPVLRYHGGKYRLASRIIPLLPPHERYVEPYGGGAGVLLRKPRSIAEIYNDLNGDVVNVFRVLRDPETAARLQYLIELTPYARTEFALTAERSRDPIEQARRTIARTFMARGTTSQRNVPTGFRSGCRQRSTTTAHDWRTYPEHIASFVDRLRGVIIECKPALEVIEQNDRQKDGPQTVYFCDPPYLPSVRSSLAGHGRQYGVYDHEMSIEDHRALAQVLREISGMAIVCGYACALYDRELYPDWQRIELQTVADGARPRTEVLWFNKAAAAAKLRAG